VNDSLGEVRFVLAGVADQIDSAQQYAGLARARIADAVEVLAGLGQQHSQPLVPDELRRAADELDRGLGLLRGGAAAIADIDARL
jgi:hypothetical protein